MPLTPPRWTGCSAWPQRWVWRSVFPASEHAMSTLTILNASFPTDVSDSATITIPKIIRAYLCPTALCRGRNASFPDDLCSRTIRQNVTHAVSRRSAVVNVPQNARKSWRPALPWDVSLTTGRWKCPDCSSTNAVPARLIRNHVHATIEQKNNRRLSPLNKPYSSTSKPI